MLPMILVEPGDLGSPDAQRLIGALNEEFLTRYPEEGSTFFRLEPHEVAPGRGAFLLARAGDEIVGCGAVRLLAADTAEIKRMYTVPAARGRGAARALLTALEAHARGLGATRLRLETGVRQPEALALYEGHGFARIPCFGQYAGSPLSVCMEKRL